MRGVTVVASSRPVSEQHEMRVRREHAHLSDEAVVALVARSSDSALAELYDRYGRTAYALALRVVRDKALAEDAVQDAFLGVWRSAERFRPERSKASTWIFTLVHRRAVDLVRREERRRAEPLDAVPHSSGPATDDEAWLGLERARVREALSRLPDQQREALELAYFGGYTQSELAERLGEPLGTIKSRMFNGLARLRDLLNDVVPEGDKWNATGFTS
jgi:RNA polymerase sigma factor (sigma-70 family)